MPTKYQALNKLSVELPHETHEAGVILALQKKKCTREMNDFSKVTKPVTGTPKLPTLLCQIPMLKLILLHERNYFSL